MAATDKPSRVQKMKDFFAEGEDARPLKNAEIIALKRADPKGFDQIADGIADGSFTY